MRHSKTNGTIKHEQMQLDIGIGKPIMLDFDGGRVSSDGGLLLLQKADRKLELTELAALCIREWRRPDLVQHSILELLRQRIYGIAAGYEDCNDAQRLREDPMHQLAVGLEPDSENKLGSQSTLCRLENNVAPHALKLLQELPFLIWARKLRRRKGRVRKIRLSMDTTCDPVHGYQQLSFYNGFYKTECYVPLFIFDDNGFPLVAELRAGNAGKADGAARALKQLFEKIRQRFGQVQIELTADAAFADPEIFELCEKNRVTYYIAAAGHSGLQHHSEALVRDCRTEFETMTGSALELKKYGEVKDRKESKRRWRQKEERIRFSAKDDGRQQEHFEDQLQVRKFGEFTYASRDWKQDRRFIYRVEFSLLGPDVRYVCTNAKKGNPREIYEERYCQRGQCENWIKDLKNYIKADRTSCQEWKANQFRLLLHIFAYILMCEIRTAVNMPFSTVETIRIQFLKIGVLVKELASRVDLRLASHHPWQIQFRLAWKMLS